VSAPSSELVPPPSPHPDVSVSPPLGSKGGSQTLLQLRGWGTQLGRLDRRPGNLWGGARSALFEVAMSPKRRVRAAHGRAREAKTH
jgi:hypothetical protein